MKKNEHADRDKVRRLRLDVQKVAAAKEQTEKAIAWLEQEGIDLKAELEGRQEAKDVLRAVGDTTQRIYQDFFESLVTLALRVVFDRPYRFILDFHRRKDKTQCRIFIGEGKAIYEDPKEDVGGGAIDVCAFALRLGRMALTQPVQQDFIWFDEPMKNIGRGVEARRTGKMISETSKRLGIQLIINTHDDTLEDIGDKVWEFTHNGKYTEVELVSDENAS